MPSPRPLRSLWLVLWLAGTGLPSAAFAQGPPPATTTATTDTAPAIRDDVRKLHNDALVALKRDEIEAAYKGFLDAWTLQKIPRIAGNLGRTELKLGKYRDAAEHLALFLRESVGLGNKEKIDLLEQLELAKARVGVLHVDVAQPGAEVWIDGVAAGTAPHTHEIYLDPGQHTVEARHTGRIARKEIEARAGAEEVVRLDVTPPSPPPPGPPPAAASARNVAGSRSIVPALVLGGVGAFGLVAGAVSLGVYSDKRGQAEALSVGISSDGSRCGGTNPHPACDALVSTAHEADVFRVAGPIFLVGGSVLAAAAGAYLLWWPTSGPPKDKNGSATEARVNVLATPQGGAVSISGRF